jgi:hypothetical protein
MGIFGTDRDGHNKFVVFLVYVRIEEFVMQQTVSPIENEVLNEHEEHELRHDLESTDAYHLRRFRYYVVG